ncbi:hypothetical protein KL942_000764 [Ogataea angusta]|uniref:Ubiquitin-conjugating enzyme E2 H n=1 Tax=Pichia angusta TaxID=870730 RepID=A0AAN6DJX7_PICAN|nr:uncharacterized protein KL928_000370 [Ogataea angusta]KAG7821895.1 hypothetical protein KL928_000370 [Ogataea angusta]KAG7831244.1 hypothetical protein KL920_000764 [Ogataea angusta]KAG7842026.1 hypothetical protein KL942_000764 [Ogataea angusta]KAG7852179.1 hypothetical protein KL940_001061 [Ogataea angusta]KAG7853320.1 hypothetical protein KL941_000370 [Ogataea angusta]
MSSLTLKADLAARYVVQNELLLKALGAETADVGHVTIGDVMGQDSLAYLEEWKRRLEQADSEMETRDSVDDELAELDAVIGRLEKEFLNPSDGSLREQNNAIFNEYCEKYNKVIYEVKENEDLNAGMDDAEEQGSFASSVLMSDYEVSLVDDNMQEFYVNFEGPKDSPYEGGLWRIHVELPDQYPYKSPSIGFQNKIFHPNIDESSGSVCLDVINQTWSPMFDIFNIFETFLPQLLNYPNAADPLNGDASSLYMRDKNLYVEKVKMYVKNYADPATIRNGGADQQEDETDSSDADLSSVDEMVGEIDL